jgi:polar amino acid transport system substrate-binding protein
MSLSSFTDSKEREQSVNFVTYYEAGTSTMVLAGNPQNITTITDLCGRPVGAENGTTQLDLLNDPEVDGSVVKACTDAGKPAPIAQGFPKQTDVNSALAAGRIDAYMADTPVVAYAVKQTGDKFEKVGEDQGTAPYGIALPKDPAALTTSVQQAMQKLMDSGAYQQILDNWGVSAGAITTAAVNGATS